MIGIRLATAEDVPFLPDIERAACSLFEQIPATAAIPLLLTPPEDFEEARRQSLLWVAATSRGPVGFALAEPLDGILHLEEMDVLPAFGRQGIGTRLVRAVCDEARARGIAAVTLCTFRDVPWNAPFYQRLGFRILNEDEMTPGLAARVREETLGGLPRELRVAMRRDLLGLTYNRPKRGVVPMKRWLLALGFILVGFIAGVVCTLGAVAYLFQHPDSVVSALAPGGTSEYLDPKRRLAKAEEELVEASNEHQRLCELGEAAMMNVEAGSLDKARDYAEEALRLTPKYAADSEHDSCYGRAVHKGNLALGRIALRSGDLETAKKHLLAAGRTPGAPELDSFGPNMSLAKELLEKGEREAPIAYFQLCSTFWKMDDGRLRQWTALANDGVVPDFGANLVY